MWWQLNHAEGSVHRTVFARAWVGLQTFAGRQVVLVSFCISSPADSQGPIKELLVACCR